MVALAKASDRLLDTCIAASTRQITSEDLALVSAEFEPRFLTDSRSLAKIPQRESVANESLTSRVRPQKPKTKPETATPDVYGALQSEFMRRIIKALQQLEQHARSRATSMYVAEVLAAIAELRNTCPHLPVIRCLNMVYDVLAVDNRWDLVTTEQYGFIGEALQALNARHTIHRNDIKAFLSRLIEVGLDPLPYPFALPSEGTPD